MNTLIRAFLCECENFLHSAGAKSILVVGVFFYSVLYPVPYEKQVPQKLPLHVVDEDHSTSSRALLRNIGATEGVSLMRYTTQQRALSALKTDETSGVLVIPRDFERNLLRSEETVIPLYCDAGRLLPYRMVLLGVKQALETTAVGVRALRLEKRGIPGYAALALQTRGRSHVWTLYNPSGNYSMNTVPPVFILILQQTLILGSAMLAVRMYTQGQQIGDNETLFLTGRMAFTVLLYSAYAVYYLWLLPRLNDLPQVRLFGDALLFLLPFFIACAAIGNVVGRFIREEASVLSILLPTSLPFLFLSGCVWPFEAMPPLLRMVGQLLPTTPTITGYMLMAMRGASFHEIIPLWYQSWGLALTYFGLACLAKKKSIMT